MLSKQISIDLLNALVAFNSTASTAHYDCQFSATDAELALFQQMPNPAGENAQEVNLAGYSRRTIKGDSIGGSPMFDTPASWDDEEGKYKITNTASIQMHAIDEDETDIQEVLGFGIYLIKDGISKLSCWGALIDPETGDPVEGETSPGADDGTAPKLTGGAVPIFQEGDFQLLFGGADNAGFYGQYCMNLLNALVLQGSSGWSGSTQSATFNAYIKQPQLILFTTLPNALGANGVEVPTTVDEISTGYTPKNLYGNSPTSGGKQFGLEAHYSGPDSKYIIENTDEIQMQSLNRNLSSSYSWRVIGFGIKAKITANASDSTLVAWGPIVNEQGIPYTSSNGPLLQAGSVPIFYKNNFKLLFGEEGYFAPWVTLEDIVLSQKTGEDTYTDLDPEIPIEIDDFDAAIEIKGTTDPNNASDQDIKWTLPINNYVQMVSNQYSPSSISNATIKSGESMFFKAKTIGRTELTVIGSDNVKKVYSIQSSITVPTKIEFSTTNPPTSTIQNLSTTRVADRDSVPTSSVRSIYIKFSPDNLDISYRNVSFEFTNSPDSGGTSIDITEDTQATNGIVVQEQNASFIKFYYLSQQQFSGSITIYLHATLQTQVYGSTIEAVLPITVSGN